MVTFKRFYLEGDKHEAGLVEDANGNLVEYEDLEKALKTIRLIKEYIVKDYYSEPNFDLHRLITDIDSIIDDYDR
jgi:nitrate reductase beta subunit